jgi:hypothetical protein
VSLRLDPNLKTHEPIYRPTAGWWSCTEPGCTFRRFYETDKGALAGAAKHLKGDHRIRLVLPVRHHGGLLGGGR